MKNRLRQLEKRRRRVLIVEDEEINREMLGHMIRQGAYDVLFATNGKEALDILRREKERLSLILLDINMPVMNGIDFLNIVRRDAELSRVPVIVVTAEEKTELECLELGAVDFIRKPYNLPEIVLARVRRIIELSEDRATIRSTELDHLSGLLTKEYFFEYSRKLLTQHPEKQMDAVAVNIDHFHLINELHGRSFGDELLKGMGGLILQGLSETAELACRSDADMFYLFCEHKEDVSEYERLLERILAGLAGQSGGTGLRLRLGVHMEEEKAPALEQRFDHAAFACNTVRKDYTRTVAVYDTQLHEREVREQQLINDMNRSIEQKDFVVYYQPKYDISGERPSLRSAEALVRWNHPALGQISPGRFIPLFEENGLIGRLDQYVWREAASQVRKWKDRYGASPRVSVNVSRVDLYDRHLKERLLGLLDEFALESTDLPLEITESAYSDQPDHMISVVEGLRESGFLIEMDDFGSGYSSLNMLTALPIDALKLDMRFIRDMTQNRKSLRMIELMMDIAHYLNVPVIAEGVETRQQYDILKETGCDLIQGYYFSKPVICEEFEELIRKENGAEDDS